MGQAFRRAAGKLRSTSNVNGTTSSSSAPSRYEKSFEKRPQAVPHDDKAHIYKQDIAGEGNAKSNAEVLEERDPNYEAMLGRVVGRITTKPGGKLEMGEAFVVRKSNRPMPKVRNTTPDTGRYEERPVAAGTLNVAQLRRIMLLYQGKADDHDGPMSLKEIAEGFHLDSVQLERIFQFLSLPPEDNNNATKMRHEL